MRNDGWSNDRPFLINVARAAQRGRWMVIADLLTALIVAGSVAAASATDPDIYLIQYQYFRPNIHYSTDDGPEKRSFVALRNEGSWRNLWSELEPRMSRDMRQVDPHSFLPIDFDRYTLLVAALGNQPSTGYSIAIRSVTESPTQISVSVIATHPGKDCIVLTVQTSPIALALIPATTKDVVFDVTDAEIDCR
jgi:hypothetical protein